MATSALIKRSVAPVSRVQAPRRGVVARAASARPNGTWLPGAEIPKHLDGSLAGDFGFDPLNLGRDPAALRWYVHAELMNGRTAMTAVAGILIPGLLTKAGVLNVPEWYDAGLVAIQPGGPASFTDLKTLLMVQLILSHFVETKRYQDFIKPKSQAEPGSFFGLESAFAGTGENGYPGFDPLGLCKDAQKFKEYKLAELKNARLAMVAFLGFIAQHAATGKGPVDNLFDHLSDPGHKNFTENGVSLPFL